MIPPEAMARKFSETINCTEYCVTTRIYYSRRYFSHLLTRLINSPFTIGKRMFALSDDDLVFERHNAENTLNNASNPIQCVTLDLHLDMIKYNFVDLLILGNSIASINRSPQKRILYDPLLQLWAKTDPVSYKQNFPESKEIN